MNKHTSAHIKASPNGTPIPAPTATRGTVLGVHAGVDGEALSFANEAEAMTVTVFGVHTGAEGEVLVSEAAFADKAEAIAVTVTVVETVVELPAIETVTVAAVEGETVVVKILRKSAKKPFCSVKKVALLPQAEASRPQ